jgi:hypothetical protein
LSFWSGAHVLYKLIHLLVINLPYLGIRIHLWTTYDKDVSLFVVKNVFGILTTVRSIYPDVYSEIKKRAKGSRHAKKRMKDYEVEDEDNVELAQVNVQSVRTFLGVQAWKMERKTTFC